MLKNKFVSKVLGVIALAFNADVYVRLVLDSAATLVIVVKNISEIEKDLRILKSYVQPIENTVTVSDVSDDPKTKVN